MVDEMPATQGERIAESQALLKISFSLIRTFHK